jgi:hypothetical protein
MRKKHKDILARFTAKFSPGIVEKWDTMIDAWDLDQTKLNPYEESCKGLLLVIFLFFSTV